MTSTTEAKVQVLAQIEKPACRRLCGTRRRGLGYAKPYRRQAMKRITASLLAVVALALAPTSVSAASCPDGFHSHEIGRGEHEHEGHQHIGVSLDAVDRNGNGLICVKHLAEDIHLHIDDQAR